MQISDSIFIEREELDLRLDQILANRFKEKYSRTYFQKLIEQGLILVNGKAVKKRTKPLLNDEIQIEFTADQSTEIIPENIPLDILFEDEDILVINKPAGLVIHPAPGNWSGTFVNALVYHCKMDFQEGIRPGIVHRLDKETSGVLIAAKNSLSQSKLIDSFSKREVVKIYLAITVGNPGKQTIQSPIGRHPTYRQKMAIVEGGRVAISHLETLSSSDKLSLVEVNITTGRTHQIRVHLASIHTPVLGDSLYGNKGYNEKWEAKRQMLHASILELPHPRTGKKMQFQAPLPKDFLHFSRLLSYPSAILSKRNAKAEKCEH